jgi:hypothetical protein
MQRMAAADVSARESYGDAVWEAMDDTEKRRIALDIAVQMELQNTAPTSVVR